MSFKAPKTREVLQEIADAYNTAGIKRNNEKVVEKE